LVSPAQPREVAPVLAPTALRGARRPRRVARPAVEGVVADLVALGLVKRRARRPCRAWGGRSGLCPSSGSRSRCRAAAGPGRGWPGSRLPGWRWPSGWRRRAPRAPGSGGELVARRCHVGATRGSDAGHTLQHRPVPPLEPGQLAGRGRERVRLAAALVEGAVAAACEQPYRRSAVGKPGSDIATAVERASTSALCSSTIPNSRPASNRQRRGLLR
jgi:hypothetical protein